MLGTKIGKPHGTVRYGDDEAALYENDDSLAEKDMGKVLPEDAVSELHMLVKGIPTGLSTNVPAGPGCQATESIFYGNDEGGTTLGFDATSRSALMKLVREKLAIHGMSYFHTSLDAALNF